MTVNAPAGFIRRDDRGLLEVFLNFLVGVLQASARTQHHLSRGSRCELDAEQRAQGVGDFTMGQASPFVEIDDGRLGIRSHLAGRGSHGVGGLQRMPALTVTTAMATLAEMDIELSPDRLAWNLLLELRRDVGFQEIAPTLGTGVRQRRLIGFANVIRWRASAAFAILGAGLATRLFGMFLGLPFGERRRLAFARALALLEQLTQFLDLGVASLDHSLKPSQSLFQNQAVRAGSPHTRSLAGYRAVSCASFQGTAAFAEDAKQTPSTFVVAFSPSCDTGMMWWASMNPSPLSP